MRVAIFIIGFIFSSFSYAANFSLSSQAFSNGGTIPELYTCKGKNISPPLAWTGAPDKTQSFALIVSDPDAPSGVFYHWIAYNIPGKTNELSIENLPQEALLGKNSSNKADYFGPCPPSGKPHHYVFTLYALDSNLNLPADEDISGLEKAMKGHVLSSTTLTGLFGK